jgi:hypothetical protein
MASALAVSKVLLAFGIFAFPAHDLQGRVLYGPLGDFRRGEEHALGERAAALEMEVLDAAFAWVRREANGQDKIDQLHFGTYRRLRHPTRPGLSVPSLAGFQDFLQVPEQKTDGKRLRARFGEVNNMAGNMVGVTRCSVQAIGH